MTQYPSLWGISINRIVPLPTKIQRPSIPCESSEHPRILMASEILEFLI